MVFVNVQRWVQKCVNNGACGAKVRENGSNPHLETLTKPHA